MAPVGLPVVVRVKRKRDLDPVDTIVVEADETPAAKRRARDAALAAELDAVLDAGLAGGPGGSKDAGDARGRDAADGADAAARAAIPARAHRRRFRRVQMTLSLEDVRNESVVRELARTVAEAASGRKRATREPEEPEDEPHSGPKLSSKAYAELAKSIRLEAERESTRVKRRATTLRRPAALSSEIGAADAMVDHFRMYDLEAAADERSPSTSVAAAPDAPDEGTLVADYLPMVAEFLGNDAPAAKESGGEARDAFVYDVYVLENDDEAAETNVTKTRVTTKPDGVAIETMPNEEATETSATFAGGTDAALFFDFTDGLGDDVSDADSQDSNREDAPDADYPDTEDSFSEDEDEDAWGRERHADRNVGGFGFWPGFGRAGALAGGDGDSDYDADEGDDGLARAWNATGTHRETAYDPQYDDVGGEETDYY